MKLPLVLAIFTACGSQPTASPPRPVAAVPAPAKRPSLRDRLRPCTVEGVNEKLLCGTYAVWENRATRSGRKIELGIVALPAQGTDVAPDPLFTFAGGPGDFVTHSARGWVQVKAIRAHRDIVLVDQRGTGLSHRLDCKVPRDPNDVQGYFGPPLPAAEVRRCRTELEPNADLALYTTSIAADDLDEVRAWLGYDKINLNGGSYGTRAAQVYIRQHGDHVRTATLVGMVGMDQYLPLYHARDGKHSLDMVFAACAKSKPCATAFPDLAAEHARVLAALDRAPGHAKAASPVDHHVAPVTFSRGVFAEETRFALYNAASASVLPYVIHRAAQGDFGPFAQLTMLWEPELRRELAYGMHLSVTCAEDVPFMTPAQIAPAIADTYLGDYRVAMQLAACKEWPRGDIPAGYHDPVRSQVPILIFSGPYDPVTPPRWAEAAIRYLPHARHVIIPEAHHGSGGLSNDDCDLRLGAEFLERGSADSLDTSCVSTMQPPPFITDAPAFEALMKEAAG